MATRGEEHAEPGTAPHDIHPDLTPERLRRVAAALVGARDSAQDDARPKVGDNRWNTSCTAFVRGIFAVTQLELAVSWLTVRNHGLRFIFSIGAVPLRFCRSNAMQPPPRYVEMTEEEEQSYVQGELFYSDTHKRCRWRLLVLPNAQGYVESIHLLRLVGKKQVIGKWQIWKRASEGGVGLPEGTPQAPPSVTHERRKQDRNTPTGTEGSAEG